LSYARGLKPGDVTPELLEEAAVEYMGEPVGLSSEVLRKALDPVEFVNGRTLYGGPAPEECRRLPEYHVQLRTDQASAAEKERQLKQAAEKQEQAINALLA
jgi:argininosuccinate lyase